MWQEIDGALYKKFEFRDFSQAFDFMEKVAGLAQSHNHHPRWHNEWNVVEIWLTTHDQNNTVTGKDRQLAQAIDRLFEARLPTVQEQVIKSLKKAILYADGGSRGNPGPSASGYVILNMDSNVVKKSGVYLGITTNNQAEYQALKLGVEEAQKLGVQELQVYMDSLLVVNQMKGLFKIRNRDLWPIHQAIKEQAKNFKKITYSHVPRELNKLADAEVNTTLDAELTV